MGRRSLMSKGHAEISNQLCEKGSRLGCISSPRVSYDPGIAICCYYRPIYGHARHGSVWRGGSLGTMVAGVRRTGTSRDWVGEEARDSDAG
ncbi:hypothetical protein VTK56DRAFT_7946 [Thermocarpiscus australiensis]